MRRALSCNYHVECRSCVCSFSLVESDSTHLSGIRCHMIACTAAVFCLRPAAEAAAFQAISPGVSYTTLSLVCVSTTCSSRAVQNTTCCWSSEDDRPITDLLFIFSLTTCREQSLERTVLQVVISRNPNTR